MIKNNKLRGLAAAAAVAALFTAQPAAADTIQINSFWGGSDYVGIDFNGSNWLTGGAYTELGPNGNGLLLNAGGFNTTNTTTGSVFQSFCVDIFDSFSWGAQSESTQDSAANVISTDAAANLGRLYTNHHAAISATSGNGINEAAFQLAVWEIVNEQDGTAYNLTDGQFRVTYTNEADTFDFAQQWLAELATPSYNGFAADIWSVQNMITANLGRSQDVVTFTAVPEPETYAMMLVGLGLLGFSARRKSQY